MTTPKPRPSIVHGESHSYPVLPLRDIVVFPHMIVPLFVGREKSIRALEEVMKNDALILLATQKNASDDDPSTEAIYKIGVGNVVGLALLALSVAGLSGCQQIETLMHDPALDANAAIQRPFGDSFSEA